MHLPQSLPALRFLTCGSVDDGKSTLIGRLLFDKNLIFDDQLATLAKDSLRFGTIDGGIDYALLVDGLEAERQQGITIDVAYRYFATSRRSFIVADAPGHEQYTRNMITGASNADLAVILVDARKGLRIQTHRHAIISSLIGIRHIVLAVNKMDTVDYTQTAFNDIISKFDMFSSSLNFTTVMPIPLSARLGDNVTQLSAAMPWYKGPALLDWLERIDVSSSVRRPFRLPVQWVNRDDAKVRGYCGTVAGGEVAIGDEIMASVSGQVAKLTKIYAAATEVDRAEMGDAVTVSLSDDIDVSRGEVLCRPAERPNVGEQFSAHVVWFGEEPMHLGRSYSMKIGPTLTPIVFTELRHRLNVSTLEKLAAKTLNLNEIASCKLAADRMIAFDPYDSVPATGGFILIDRASNATIGAGMIDYHLRRSENVRPQALTISKNQRVSLMGHAPRVLWFTGLSGAGKSTIANLVEAKLNARGTHTMLLDGDNLRHGLTRDLGFTESARIENIRRVGEVSKLMTEAGLVVLCSFIAPFAADREMVRRMLEPGEFVEIYVHAPLETVIARDPKGLYKRALAGKIKNFTGIDQSYDVPKNPELILDTVKTTADELADEVISWIDFN